MGAQTLTKLEVGEWRNW